MACLTDPGFMLCWQTRRVLCYHKEASLVNTHITSLSNCPRWELQKYLQMLKTRRKRFFLPWHKLKVPSIKVDFVGKEVVPVIRKAQLTFKDQEKDFCVVVPQDGRIFWDATASLDNEQCLTTAIAKKYPFPRSKLLFYRIYEMLHIWQNSEHAFSWSSRS